MGADAFDQLARPGGTLGGRSLHLAGQQASQTSTSCAQSRQRPMRKSNAHLPTPYYSTTTTYTRRALCPLARVHAAQGLALKAGVQVGVLTSAKKRLHHIRSSRRTAPRECAPTARWSPTTKTSPRDGYSKTDFSIPVGISSGSMHVVHDAHYNLGLSKAQEGPRFQEPLVHLQRGLTRSRKRRRRRQAVPSANGPRKGQKQPPHRLLLPFFLMALYLISCRHTHIYRAPAHSFHDSA